MQATQQTTTEIQKTSNRGGAGRGQGMKPIYGTNMAKTSIKLPEYQKAWLQNEVAEKSISASLRVVLAGFQAHGKSKMLMDDPGAKEGWRSAVSIPNGLLQVAASAANGKSTIGFRLIIDAAIAGKFRF